MLSIKFKIMIDESDKIQIHDYKVKVSKSNKKIKKKKNFLNFKD